MGLAKPAREAAYRLAALDEPKRSSCCCVSSAVKRPELRAFIAEQFSARHRLPARAALRQALDDGHATVRHAVLPALRKRRNDLFGPAAGKGAGGMPMSAGGTARSLDLRELTACRRSYHRCADRQRWWRAAGCAGCGARAASSGDGRAAAARV